MSEQQPSSDLLPRIYQKRSCLQHHKRQVDLTLIMEAVFLMEDIAMLNILFRVLIKILYWSSFELASAH